MLSQFDLFKGLNPQDIDAIAAIVRRQTFQRGDLIFRQGDSFEDFFVIESGQVEISIIDAFKRKRVLTVLRNLDFFGEMGIFDLHSVRSATAKAIQTTTLLIIPGIAFQTLLKEKPTLSLQLLNALSKRLRDANLKVAAAKLGDVTKEGKILTVGSPRNGYGKSTFATTMAQVLAHESARNVLFIDLDLYFGEGSYYLGITAGKSFPELYEALKDRSDVDRDTLLSLLVKHSDRFYSLPAPVTFLDAEQVDPMQIVTLLKICRQHFDYLVIDTDSALSDAFLNVLDLSDQVFFLVETTTPICFRNNARYFQTLLRLNLPPERIHILGSKTLEGFGADRLQGLFRGDFKFKVLGGLPHFKTPEMEFGKTHYQVAPESPYCMVVRHFIKSVLKEDLQSQKGGNSFMDRFFGRNVNAANLVTGGEEFTPGGESLSLKPGISQASIASIFKHIRNDLVGGFFTRVQQEILDLLEICPESPLAYLFLGEAFIGQKRPAEAIAAFRKTLDLDPENHLAMGFWGHLTGKPEIFQKAQESLQKKLKDHPNFADFHNDFGKLQFLAGNHERALLSFRKAMEINPAFQEAHLNLALTMGEMKNYLAAIQELLKMKEKNLRVYYLLGKFLHHIERFSEAQKALLFALEYDADFLDIQQRLDSYQDYFHQIDMLTRKCLEILDIHPNFPDLHVNYGDLLIKTGNLTEARQAFTQALKLNPSYAEAKERLKQLDALPEIVITRSSEAKREKAERAEKVGKAK